MCGDPIPLPAWMAEDMARHYGERLEQEMAQRFRERLEAEVRDHVTRETARIRRAARLENEYTTSPVVTVNGTHVAWLNSPMLVGKEDQEWITRIRQQLQSQESLDYYWQGE